MNNSKIQTNLVNASFQATAFLITLFCMATLFTIRYKNFKSYDPIENLQPNNRTSPSISAGIHIIHLEKFDVQHNAFKIHSTIWFAYDPKIVSIDIIKKFSISNGQIIDISEPKITTYDHETIAQFNVHLSFYCTLDYRMFPLDDHHILIGIVNDFLPDHLVFESSTRNITAEKNIYLPGWSIVKTATQAGYTKTVLERDTTLYDIKQKVEFIFMCDRSDPGIAINILLTLILMLFISLLTFSSQEDSVLIVSVAMVALIGYRMVMQTMGPDHISYFTFADYLYLLSLIGSIIALFGGIFTREKNSSLAHKKTTIAAIYVLYVSGSTIVTIML